MEKPPIVSEKPLIVVFKNFMRNRMVNLSALSVRHFLPNAEIYCLTLYKQSMDEYTNQDPLDDYIEEWTAQTRWNSGIDIHDHIENGKCSGYGNLLNGCFFTEGYNLIFDRFKDVSEKVLMLNEDHYFTTGKTLQEAVDIEWDVAWAGWDDENINCANASIIGVNPVTTAPFFPMVEQPGQVEYHIGQQFAKQIREAGLKDHLFSTRRSINYFGDGRCVNSSVLMRSHMEAAGIL